MYTLFLKCNLDVIELQNKVILLYEDDQLLNSLKKIVGISKLKEYERTVILVNKKIESLDKRLMIRVFNIR